MTTTNTTNGVTLKLNIMYQRTFYFGTTGQTVTVNISKAGNVFGVATNSPATELSAGFYTILLSTVDTNTVGDLAFNCTAGAGGPATWTDQVVTQLFSDLAISGSGRALIGNNLQQNVATNGFLFPMANAVTGGLMSGLTITAQRTLGSGGFSPCTNVPVEVSAPSGIYSINLSATDLNSATVGLLFTATGATTLFVPLVTTQ